MGFLDGLRRGRRNDRAAAGAPDGSGGTPDAGQRQEQAWRQEIARQEWIVLHVPAVEGFSPTLQYTAGLTERGLPELLVYGLRLKTGMLVLGELATRLLDGVEYPDGAPLPDLLPDLPGTQLWDVSWLPDPPEATRRLYGTAVRFRQLVVPDPGGRLPWEPGCSGPPQPVLFTPPNGLGPRPAVLATPGHRDPEVKPDP